MSFIAGADFVRNFNNNKFLLISNEITPHSVSAFIPIVDETAPIIVSSGGSILDRIDVSLC